MNSQSRDEGENYGQSTPETDHASHRKPNSYAQTAPQRQAANREYLTEAVVEGNSYRASSFRPTSGSPTWRISQK